MLCCSVCVVLLKFCTHHSFLFLFLSSIPISIPVHVVIKIHRGQKIKMKRIKIFLTFGDTECQKV